MKGAGRAVALTDILTMQEGEETVRRIVYDIAR
jgi:hypothetical protein